MKVRLSKPIKGYRKAFLGMTPIEESVLVHASIGDVLPVILHNPTHYVCDSVIYPGRHIIVYPSQVAEVIAEVAQVEAEDSIEKYYNVYEEPKSIIELENDLPYSTLQSDDESMDQ